ncbi:amidohydrolase family protein [Flagellimonas sp. 389]|uniref:metal-dependent hydrolase family protein n=1 Tax=Flagellimonas sp. 389 TaxID=2835862 RepID=UPI001BD5AB35|nr:amidohydrolase family protein [Flagellimonas sp. 389]MBS9462871.1 amidohydrolase family protein [Flagellimonas sp. 389]
MIDVVEGTLKNDVLVVIENSKILKIDKASNKNRYKDIIDLSEYTILPGLIDCHTHLTNPYFDKSIDVYETAIASYGILGTLYAKKTLDAGFTTVRDVGGYFYSDVALRDAIDKGWIPGPRMYVSGKSLSMTGGHGAWANWLAPHLQIQPNPGNIVDGEDEVRKQTRTLIKNSVDLIKINATGGFGTSKSIPGAASFTIEEMQAAVEEAQKRGLRVAAHAHGAEGIKNAVKAGVTSIEHGTFLDDESIQLMKNQKVYLVMDILAAHYELIEKNDDFSDKEINLNNQEMYQKLSDNFNIAYTQGVKMAFGTDASIFEHGRNAEQFHLMVKAGMTEIDAIKSATIVAARLIGIEDKAGSIEEGKWADIIAVKGNPLEDITVLEKAEFVMKYGKIYKSPVK